MTSYKIPISIILLLMSSCATASAFSAYSAYANTSITIQSSPISDLSNEFNALIQNLNSQVSMKNINNELTDFGIDTLKININKIPFFDETVSQEIFITKGKGVSYFEEKYDKEVTLSYSKVKEIVPFITEGALNFISRFQILAIYKLGDL